MILTGTEIDRQRILGAIHLEPFSSAQLNPNSYNYRLGSTLKVFRHFDGRHSQFSTIAIPDDGYVLDPGQMYLAHTYERIGSDDFAMSLIGRSSIGRLGLFLQLSANLGHTTSSHHWTLELMAALPIRIYPRMIIGQVSFWENSGLVDPIPTTYDKFHLPQERVVVGCSQ